MSFHLLPQLFGKKKQKLLLTFYLMKYLMSRKFKRFFWQTFFTPLCYASIVQLAGTQFKVVGNTILRLYTNSQALKPVIRLKSLENLTRQILISIGNRRRETISRRLRLKFRISSQNYFTTDAGKPKNIQCKYSSRDAENPGKELASFEPGHNCSRRVDLCMD